MKETVVTVTKKGQATIPKELRKKHRISRRALVVDAEEGVLIKPVPDPMIEKGSLTDLFRGKTSRQLIEEARYLERTREKKLVRGLSE